MKSKLYTPYQIHKMSEKDIRKAYSELRSVANKRLERQQNLNIGVRARTGFRFPTISKILQSSKDTVSAALADVSMWLKSDRTTVKGEKAAMSRFKSSMESMGYPELVKDMDTAYRTMEYLDELREEYSDAVYDSGDVLDVLQQAELLNISDDILDQNIQLFYENKDKFLKIKTPKRKGYTPKAVQKMINKYSR